MAIATAWPQCRLHATSFDEEQRELPDQVFDLILLGLGGEQRNSRVMAAIEQARQIRANTPVVVLCDRARTSMVAAAADAGARGFIALEQTTLNVAVSILRLVQAGGTYLPVVPHGPETSAAGFDSGGHAHQRASLAMFTSRELDILSKIAEGKPNKIISYELGIGESTTKIHIRHIMRKTGLTNRTQVALLARELLDQDPTFSPPQNRS